MYNCTHVLYLQTLNTQSYILFPESQPRFILKNFANFSLDILIKHILMNRKECS